MERGVMDLFIFLCVSLFASELFAVLPIQVSASSQLPLLSAIDSQNVTFGLPNAIRHAPRIFNTLYGAMRQWSSSTHHNGMSYFPVTVPANTILYHGRKTADLVTGIDWLSFEVEHAEIFARFDPFSKYTNPLLPPKKEQFEGYLHIYQTSRPLTKLLYLDGLAAGKSTMGTLDSTELVLLRDSDFRSRPGASERDRLLALCSLSPHIEGILRMEMGLEIVLCNISESVHHLNAKQRPKVPEDQAERRNRFFFGEYARTISQRFGGISAGRALVDYSSMVSAYFYPINLTNPDPQRLKLPRIDPQDEENIEKLRDDVLALFGPGERPSQSVDWQGITDMVVTRYSDRLAFLNSTETTEEDFINEIGQMIELYMDFHSLNLTSSKEDCAMHYLLPVKNLQAQTDQLIFQAILTVTKKICEVLFQIHGDLIEPGGSKNLTQARLAIQSLTQWLDWSTWSECGKCDILEVCFIAAWPIGAKEDHYKPGCIDMYKIWGREGYWDVYYETKI